MPLIDRNSPTPYYQQVFEQIARGIESGIYPAGKKLPSIRECARDLGVSNTTIELAYQKLTEQGYVEARRGSGYTICEIEPSAKNSRERFGEAYNRALEELEADDARAANGAMPAGDRPRPHDFAYDAVDQSLFPYITWARISREIFFSVGSEHACLYNDCQGLYELREEIARYASGEYGLSCVASQILVMPTTRDLISSIMGLFDPASTVFAMGNPGYDEVRRKITESCFGLKTIAVHPFPEWDECSKDIEGANVVFATPASQFPTNHAMPLALRQRLVAWAKETGAYLIDDEYGWEFQSGATRMPSLAALDDAGRVITVGTFSNSFTPAVCLSYAILPPQLMLKWRKAHRGSHPQVPWQTQATMAVFMREDHWRTHIRKMRTAMQRKRQTLLAALDAHMGSRIEMLAGLSSLFVLVQTTDGRQEDELVEAARKAGITVYPTSRYWNGEAPAQWRYVLVGYAGIPENDIEPGIRALACAWGLAD